MYTEQQTQETSITPSTGFETAIQAIEGPQTYALRPYGHLDRFANPAYLAIIFALPSPHFPSSHDHKVETRRSMSLFFKNSFKLKWTMSLYLYTTTINPISSTVYCGVHVTRDQIRLTCKSQKQDNSFIMLSTALVSRRVTCQRTSFTWKVRKTEFSGIKI